MIPNQPGRGGEHGEHDAHGRASDRKVVLTTIGTLGDLHPMIAIALSLKQIGIRPVMAVAADHVERCRAAGLEAVPALPGFAEVARRMGLGEAEAADRILRDQRAMLEQVILPALPVSAHALAAISADAEAIVSSAFVLAAPIVAEARRLPLVSVVLQPMAMLSRFDPPATPDFRLMRHAPIGPLGGAWNGIAYAALRWALKLRYGGDLDAVRGDFGLPRGTGPNMLEVDRSSQMVLCCYSPEFGPLQRDAPVQARLIGFPIFDHRPATDDGLPASLERFLSAGSPPVVFTLGSFAVNAAGDFFAEAAGAARRIGTRAMLLTGAGPARSDGDVFSCDYAPHSLVFSRASAIVHHGGVGTVGQALRAGKPQLIVPHMGDQHDNAARVARLGLGRTVPASRFRAKPVARHLSALLRDDALVERARGVARRMAGTTPAMDAAELIASVVEGRRL